MQTPNLFAKFNFKTNEKEKMEFDTRNEIYALKKFQLKNWNIQK